jgi:PKHD-type hydroxylase
VEYFNNEKFKFNLYNRFQNIQFTKYEDGDYYKWHVDVGPSSDTCIRKISMTIQLSDDTSYSGGDLQFGHSDEETFTVSREKGSVTLFPSIVRHQVTPVTNGTRYSLVVWATGAPFQ